MRALLAYCNVEFSDELKKMYDGYCFGATEVYNPWSVSCYAARKKMESYWVNTSENSYHMMMLGMCAFMRRDYIVKSNWESGEGRSDICLYSRSGRYPNLILEFKYTRDEKTDLPALAEEALEQIEEKKYDAEMTGEVQYIGLAHCGKRACVRWR